MTPALPAPLDRSIARARCRLLGDRWLHAAGLGTTAGLAAGLAWVLAEPWVLATPPDGLRWIVVGTAAGLGWLAGTLWSFATRPSRETAALEIDRRFELHERVTTAVGLRTQDRDTPAGQALLADAAAKAAALPVAEKFPIRPRRSLGGIPVLAGAIAAAFAFYQPDTTGAGPLTDTPAGRNPVASTRLPADAKTLPSEKFTKLLKPDQLDRKKSNELLKLEEELDRTMEKWKQNEPKDEQQAREKVAELTALEDKLARFKEQEYQKLKQLENQLQQLDKLSKENEFEDGPARELNDALSKGNLKKAQEELDELKKKAKDKKLESKDLAKLDNQLKEMKKQLTANKEKKEKLEQLKKKIDQAKKDGKDAEALERELAQAEAEMKQAGEQMEKMAQKMEKIRQMAQNGEMEQLAEELAQLGDQMKGIEGEIQDLEDADDYLQKLRDELKKACKQCEGDPKKTDKLGSKDDEDWSPFGNPGMGKRKEDKDAKTNSKDERIRGLFDKTGQKRYAGAIKGPAFTKKSTVELDQQIQQAAQDAPRAIDTQRVPKEAQTGVKEYFEKIGGTEKK
jgi:hypothetical protein